MVSDMHKMLPAYSIYVAVIVRIFSSAASKNMSVAFLIATAGINLPS